MRFAKWMLAVSVGSFLLGAPAWANIIIHPTYDATITDDANAAAIEATIQSAINIYEATFSDPITVNITFQEMTTGLGQSNFSLFTITYESYLAALQADAKTSDDATALAHLPAGPNNPVNGSLNIQVKPATLRAVGLSALVSSDGSIGLNTHSTDVGSPDTSGQFSLMSVTEHEIDEILGLGSSLDFGGDPTPEDLFRYTSAGARSFTMSSSAMAFFSIDGTTDLAQFHQRNGDTGDFGDWESGGPVRVQDWQATSGANPPLSVELIALDVIGYDRVVAVPEPGTWVLLTGALAILGGLTRRRAG